MAGLLSMTLIIYMITVSAIAPIFWVSMYLERRDCEAVNKTECTWQILPKEEPTNDR